RISLRIIYHKMSTIKFTTKTATLFFSIGTLLLLIQIVVRGISTITIVGLYYVIFSVLINLFLVLLLILKLIFKSNKISTLKSIGILTINIPIAYLYFYIVNTFLI
ncbi:MAG: hypothetical protein AB1Z17_13155, partial [Lutibacter sp.]